MDTFPPARSGSIEKKKARVQALFSFSERIPIEARLPANILRN